MQRPRKPSSLIGHVGSNPSPSANHYTNNWADSLTLAKIFGLHPEDTGSNPVQSTKALRIGRVAELAIATVLKTVVLERDMWVRIPPLPQS